MKTTNYPGIDYGMHTGTNRNKETGIHYGVIQRDSVVEYGQEIYDNGRNLTLENFDAEVKKDLRGVIKDYFSDYKHSSEEMSKLDRAVEAAFDELVNEGLHDNYTEDNDSYLYEKDGYKITTCLDNDFMVIESPFYTYAQFCSPCVPGAGNLDSVFGDDTIDQDISLWRERAECAGFSKIYCFGHDWFEDGVAPYPIFNIKTNEQVNPQV